MDSATAQILDYPQKFADKWNGDEIESRLKNWATYLHIDNTFSKLGFPDQAPFVFCPRKGHLVADLDAQWIEDIVSTLFIRDDFTPVGSQKAFLLRLEYAERGEKNQPPVSQKAHDYRAKYQCKCGRSSYYDKLKEAKRMLRYWAGPIR